MKLELCCV